MKLLIYNVGYGKGWTSPFSYLSFKQVWTDLNNFIADLKVDVAGLLEVKSGKVLDDFGFSCFSCKYRESLHHVPFVNSFGNCLFSKKDVSFSKHFFGSGFKRLVIRGDFGSFNLLLVHLSLFPRARSSQINELSSMIDSKTIIAGDFNISSLDEVKPLLDRGLKNLVCQPTFPSWNPKKIFDLVLVPEKMQASAEVLNVKLSDHLPVLVNIK